MREVLAKWFLSPLAGATFSGWSQILKRYGKEIPPQYWLSTAFTTAMSLMNSVLASREGKKYRSDLESIQVQSPVFIVGHYRSGTTHLWRLLIQDEHFIYPKVTETLFPHTLLTFGAVARKLDNWFSPDKRPQDGVKHTANSPLTEEWALCASTFLSVQMSRYFPQHRMDFKHMLSLKNATEQERAAWKEALHLFAKKLLLKKGRKATVLFKAPTNTAKIPLLLDVFPDARFIHIYRNPYRVFQSTVKMEEKSVPFCRFQPMPSEGLEKYIIWRYQEMYRSFLKDMHLIPKGHFTQLSYEGLVQDRAAAVRKIYQDLNLRNFDEVEPQLTNYIKTISDYQTNNYSPLPEPKKGEIATIWRPFFEAFGYSTDFKKYQDEYESMEKAAALK